MVEVLLGHLRRPSLESKPIRPNQPHGGLALWPIENLGRAGFRITAMADGNLYSRLVWGVTVVSSVTLARSLLFVLKQRPLL